MTGSATLVALGGPCAGQVFGLDDETTIGRDPGCRIVIGDSALSRCHCVIQSDGQELIVRDLDSRNGTFVNGTPITRRPLADGDQIQIGDTVLLVCMQPRAAAETVEVSGSATGTVQLRLADAVYLHPAATPVETAARPRLARDLQALLAVSAAINAIRGRDELQKRLLDLLFEILPADSGAILLLSPGGGTFASVLSRRRDSRAPVEMSRTVVDRVVRERVSVLTNDVPGTESLRDAPSLVAAGVRSVLCVPLFVYDEPLGAIYLAANEAGRFEEEDLQLVTGIAGLSAVALDNVRHLEWLDAENQRLRAALDIDRTIIGESAPMQRVLDMIARIAPTDSTVLLAGETGTGKELAARAIHAGSRRAPRPFVSMNCAAVAETLLESELFGYERGAFTGAVTQKKGKLEVADGGTLFLDEIGETSPAFQTKLLRVLQEREFERVGGTRPIRVDIRVIAATNRDLRQEVRKGTFRQDLYYRLDVVRLELPPLRDRREDIPMLAQYFITKYRQKCNRRLAGLSQRARACLMRYDWPGNVRELENAMERAVVLATGPTLQPEDLPETVLERQPEASSELAPYHDAVRQAKRRVLLEALKQAKGRPVEAARLLGLNATYLHRLLTNLNLRPTADGDQDRDVTGGS